MNKIDLIQKLKQLEGITPDERSFLINLVNTKKKYGLIWEDKPEDVEEQLRGNLPVLKEVKDKAIINGEENPNHILIEGDNLHALTALTFTHEGKIDVIYIDPPYNTGEKDFKYNDRYVDKEDGFKHSKWLSFMSKRLLIMKRLLSNTGVIIIHIDENEFDVLSLLLETEIFSEQDCLGYIIWNKKNPKGDARKIANMHEYILCFANNKEQFLMQSDTLKREKPNALEIIRKAKSLYNKIGKRIIPDEIKEVIKPFNYSEEVLKDFEVQYDLLLANKEFQSWIEKKMEFSEGEKAYKFIDESGNAFQTVSMAWPNKEEAPEDYFIPLIHPINNQPCPLPERGWRNPSYTMTELLGNEEPIILPAGMVIKGEIAFTINNKKENNQPRRKYLLKDNLLENTSSIFNYGSSDDAFFNSIQLAFPYAKPVEVAKYLIKSIHPNPEIILDCFAGSGTALHAIIELNTKDKNKRTGIIITNNEVDEKTEKKLIKEGIRKGTPEFDREGICEKVTYPRLNKVINGFNDKEGIAINGINSNNLRYYKTEFVSSMKTEQNKRLLTQASTELLCIKEDCYFQITKQSGFNEKFCNLFTNKAGRYLIIVYHSRNQLAVCEQLIAYIKQLQNLQEPVRLYAFSPEKETLVEDFYEVADKIDAVPLPEALYNAYRATFKILKLDKKIIEPKVQAEHAVTTTETTLFTTAK